MACVPSKKARWGKDGGWGEGNAPCALAKGVSFPPQKNALVLTDDGYFLNGKEP